MAIEPTGPSASNINTSSHTTTVQAESATKHKNKAPNTTSTDAVTLTPTAEKLKELEEKLAAIPEVDSDRVAQLREAINSGQYKIDANSTAEKFLDFEKLLS